MDDATKALHQEVDSLLSPVEIQDPMLQARLDKLRSVAKNFAHGIVDIVPEGVERDMALIAVRQAMHLAEVGTAVRQSKGIPKITAARVSEADAVALRDRQNQGGQ